MPLSQKHEAVALAYLADPQHIGWRAYQSVYPKSSQRAAETSWSSLLKIPEFSARIAQLGEQAAQAAVATARQVLEELTKIGLSNMQDFVGEDDILHPVASLTRAQAAAIQEYTVEHYVDGHGDEAQPVKKIKLKLANKHTSLEALGRHHKLFTERHEHDFVGGIAERLTAALERIGDTDDRDHSGEADTDARNSRPSRVRPRRKARARGTRPAKR